MDIDAKLLTAPIQREPFSLHRDLVGQKVRPCFSFSLFFFNRFSVVTSATPAAPAVSQATPSSGGLSWGERVAGMVLGLVLSGQTDYHVLEAAVRSLGVRFGVDLPNRSFEDVKMPGVSGLAFVCLTKFPQFLLSRSDLFSRYGDEVSLSKREKKRLGAAVPAVKPPSQQSSARPEYQQPPASRALLSQQDSNDDSDENEQSESLQEPEPFYETKEPEDSFYRRAVSGHTVGVAAPVAAAAPVTVVHPVYEKCQSCQSENLVDFKFCSQVR